MAKEKPITFDENQIPIAFEETVGKVKFVAVRNDKFENDEFGQRTDKLRAQSIEVTSEAQQETFNVDLPPNFNLGALNLKFGDEIKVEGVKFTEPWAMLSAGDSNIRNASTGFSIIAESISKVAGSVQGNAQPTNKREKEQGKD